MSSHSKLKVAIAGASGETGQSIVNGLLDSPVEFEVIALVRKESAHKDIYQQQASRGVTIKTTSFDVEPLVTALAGVNVIISCLHFTSRDAEEALIDASHTAGVNRYVPNCFATVCPRGVFGLHDGKEDLLDKAKRLYLPFTVINVGWWLQNSIPAVPSGKLDDKISFPETIIGADGNVPTAVTDIADVGKYVARIIADPRTLNKYVFAYGQVTTQNEIWAAVEELSGEAVPRIFLSPEKAEASIASLKQTVARNPGDLVAKTRLVLTEYAYTRIVRGDNSPEHAEYLGYLDGKDLYPDIQCQSVRDFIKDLVQGEGRAIVYAGRGEVQKPIQNDVRLSSFLF